MLIKLYWAPTNAKRLAYKTLCMYPSSKYISNIEQLEDQAVQFIAGTKGRDGVIDAETRLGLIPLRQRRRNQWLRLLMRILARKEHHSSLFESYIIHCESYILWYKEIMNQPRTTMSTRSHTRRIPATFWTNNTQYYNRFLPRTIHDLRGQWKNCIMQCQYWANTYCQHHIDRAYRTCTDKYRPDWVNEKNATNV